MSKYQKLKLAHDLSVEDADNAVENMAITVRKLDASLYQAVYLNNLWNQTFQRSFEIHRGLLNLPSLNLLIQGFSNGDAILDAFEEGMISYCQKVAWLISHYVREENEERDYLETYQIEATKDNLIWKEML